MGKAAGVAWGLCGLTVGLAVGILGLAIADPASLSNASDPRVPGGGVPVAAFEAVVLAALGVIGALVASRQPRNAVGWILCAIPLFLGVLILSGYVYWSLALAHPPDTEAADLVAWLASWIWIPAIPLALTLFPLLFPSGSPPTPRWRPIGWLALAALPLLFVGVAFTPGQLEGYPVTNPLGTGDALKGVVEAIGALGFALLIVAALGSVASLVVRFRRSQGDERQQLKWVTAAMALFVVIFAIPSDEIFNNDDVGFASLLLGLLVVAAAVAIAILRYRLYDIDVVVNRTLVYGALTATLAAAYLGSVLLLQLALGGLTSDSNLAIAGSTLAVAALFRPARNRIQELVDRRFFRRRYDAQRILEGFGSRLRDELALDSLSAELRGVVAETMQPAHVSLWLRETSA